MPQLDGLRAIAVGMVIVWHWLPLYSIFNRFIPNGPAGVILFFVLSGYLITAILLKSRIEATQQNLSSWHVLKQFYIRRSLRIFPIYYLTLFIAYLLQTNLITQGFTWHLFYLSNIYLYKINDWHHFWTLSVEEQFYLIWPFIILFARVNWLKPLILCFIIIGPFSRSLFIFSENINPWVLPFCNFDCFGVGALLAYTRFYSINLIKGKKILLWLSLLIVIFFSIPLQVAYKDELSNIFFRLSFSIVSGSIIAAASHGIKGIIGKMLEHKMVVYIGKISYGLYLFHPLVPVYLGVSYLDVLSIIPSRFYQIPLCTIVLFAVASFSWFFIEKPINSLKKYFTYIYVKQRNKIA